MNEWIKINDATPKFDQDVLGVSDDDIRICHIDHADHDTNELVWYDVHYLEFQPTHWMPLPVPPKESQCPG